MIRNNLARAFGKEQNRVMSKKAQLLKRITAHYLASHDFNGLPVREVIPDFKRRVDLIKALVRLIQEGAISLNFGDIHPNPHIKAFQQEPPDKQIDKLKNANLLHICAYPTQSHLKSVVDVAEYQDRPFTLRLAIGEPQLAFESFDLSVLEFYRNDPRYYYTHNDISGRISIHDEYCESDKMAESDQVLLQTFGFSYDSDLNRAVAVFLRYLLGLSPQHQQIWNAKIVKGDYKLHPDYYKASILGSWDLGLSLFDAFIEEIHQINEISKLMDRPPLFKNDFKGDKKPRGFGFLIRPTLKEFNDFIHLLDKAISENINREFFLDDVDFEYDETRKDGKVIVRQKGTIQILDEWLKKNFNTPDRSPIEQMIATFKKIRQLRQRPAHAIDGDILDQKYFKEQREIMIKAYEAVEVLREIFKFHPRAIDYEIPHWLTSRRIWTY